MTGEGDKARFAPLERFTALLGEDAFFVPCEWGTKKSLVTYVERPFAGTKSEAYRALFEVQEVNIAVYLGKASGGLCAIDFNRDVDLAAFLAVNPRLERTTRSRGSRGGMIWVRIEPAPDAATLNPQPSTVWTSINHQPSTINHCANHGRRRAGQKPQRPAG